MHLVRERAEPRTFDLPASHVPGATLYFEVLRDPGTREANCGERLEYEKTANLDEFYVAKVDPSGLSCRAVLFRKERPFSDAYEYWPSGVLRKRTLTKPEQPPGVQYYDPEGHPVDAPVPELSDGQTLPENAPTL